MMRKKIAIFFAAVLALTGCGNPGPAGAQNGAISPEEAEARLEKYLSDENILKADYELEPLDPVLGEFENEELFRFEMRYREEAEGLGGNLIANYLITTDGEKIFWYDPGEDKLVLQSSDY